MQWIPLADPAQLDDLIEKSRAVPQVIYKHSTRCRLSSTVLQRLETAKCAEGVDFYFLDLLMFRQLSNLVAERFQVRHASPQVLLIRDGQCIFNESHLGITMEDLENAVNCPR